MIAMPNKPDGTDRRQPFSFRESEGKAGITGFAAAAAHLERSPRFGLVGGRPVLAWG